MRTRDAFLAVPGDLMTRTGGYLYDRRLLQELNVLGRDVGHLELPGSFPWPSAADQETTARCLGAVPRGCPLIIDGLAFGALDPATLTALASPIVALVHHPLAEERGLDEKSRQHLYRSERANLALADHVVVTSPHTAELLTSHYAVTAERITIARPGVDPCPDPAIPTDPLLILSVGIVVPRKGHDVLLRALAQLVDRPWQAVIVGAVRDEPHGEQVAALAATGDLAKRVRLAGGVTDEALAALFRQAGIFTLATRYEGHGIVFDEAMAHGLPIVSCAVGAVPDTVAPGAGALVPADDADALAQALGRVIDDGELRATMARAARRAAADLPGWDQAARRVADVIDGIVIRA